MRANRPLIWAGTRRWPIISRILEEQGFPRLTTQQIRQKLYPVSKLLRALRSEARSRKSEELMLAKFQSRRKDKRVPIKYKTYTVKEYYDTKG